MAEVGSIRNMPPWPRALVRRASLRILAPRPPGPHDAPSMRRLLSLALVLAVAPAWAEGARDGLAAIRKSGELRWGADAQGGAPYVFQDPMDPNHLIGFEVELADALAKRLRVKPRPVHGQWDKLLELLERGDFDIALNGVEVAEEKRRVALLSRPYFVAEERLTVRRGDASAPRTLEALRGR